MSTRFKLPDEFSDVYRRRYEDSISFIDKIIEQKKKGLKDEFFISYLAGNELFSAIRDEVRSIILFNKGIPVSRWRDSRNNPDISNDDSKEIHKKTLKSFDILFEKKAISFIKEQSPDDDQNYWNIYPSLLFLIKEIKTQDGTLLTTAILNRADYFVTKDEPLMKAAKKMMYDNYQLTLMKPSTALQTLKKQVKK